VCWPRCAATTLFNYRAFVESGGVLSLDRLIHGLYSLLLFFGLTRSLLFHQRTDNTVLQAACAAATRLACSTCFCSRESNQMLAACSRRPCLSSKPRWSSWWGCAWNERATFKECQGAAARKPNELTQRETWLPCLSGSLSADCCGLGPHADRQGAIA
jgi:hypothetical protein